MTDGCEVVRKGFRFARNVTGNRHIRGSRRGGGVKCRVRVGVFGSGLGDTEASNLDRLIPLESLFCCKGNLAAGGNSTVLAREDPKVR